MPPPEPTLYVFAETGGATMRRAVRRIGLDTSYQVISQLAPAAAVLIALPYLVRRLGPDLYGLVALLSAALLYFTMLDLGLGRATTLFVARSLGSGRPEEAGPYLWASVALLSCVGLAVCLACWAAVPLFVVRVISVPAPYRDSATQAFHIVCGAVPFVTITATFRGYLEASGKFLTTGIIAAAGGAANYAAPAAAIAMGGGLRSAAAAIAGVRILTCAVFILACIACAGATAIRPSFNPRALRRMLAFGGWLSISNVVGTGMVYGDRFLLGAWAGVVAVTSYSLPLDLIGRLQVLAASLCAVLFPLLSRLDQSSSPRFGAVYRGATALMIGALGPPMVALAVSAPTLMAAWLGARAAPASIFAAQVFLAGVPIQSLTSIGWAGLHARGRADLTALMHMSELPIFLVLFYFGATRFGVRGAALAWLARILIDFILTAVLLRFAGAAGTGVPPELAAVALPISILAIRPLPIGLSLAAAGALSIATWAWAWRGLLTGDDRLHLRTAVRSWLRPSAA